MPRIPQGNFDTSPKLGGANVRSSITGQVGQAQQQLAGAVGQLAGSVGAILQKQKDAEDAAFVTEQTNKLMLSESEKFTELSARGDDIDFESDKERYSKNIDELIKLAPSEEAAQALKLNADSAYTKKFLPMFTQYQSKRNVKKRVDSFGRSLDDIQKDTALGRTDKMEAFARNQVVLEQMAENVGGAVDIEKATINSKNTLTTNLVSNMIKAGNGRQAISEIKAGEWDDYADAGTLKTLLNYAERDIEQRSKTNKSLYLKQFNDYLGFLQTGQDDEKLAAQYSPESLKANLPPEKAAELDELVKDTRDFGIMANDLKSASAQDVNKFLEDAVPKSAEDFGRESKQLKMAVRAVQQRQQAIAKDPAGYVNKNTPIGQMNYNNFTKALASGDAEYIQQQAEIFTTGQKAIQANLGVPPEAIKLLPKELEAQHIQQLNDFSQGGEGVVQNLVQLKTIYGDDFGLVQKQLQQSGNLKTGLSVLAGMDFGQEQIRAAEALAVPDKEYKEFIGNDDYKQIKEDSREYLADFQQTITGQVGAESVYKEHKVAIERLAMKYIADGLEDNPDDALEKAANDILDSRFEFIDTYRVPKEFDGGTVQGSVEREIERIKMGEYDLLIPDSAMVQNPEDRKAVYLQKIAPTPVTSPSGDGIMFIHKNGAAILQSNGKPIIVPFTQLEDGGINPNIMNILGSK